MSWGLSRREMAPLLSSNSPEISFFLPPWPCQVCPVPRPCLAISPPRVQAAAGLYQVMSSGPLWLSSCPCLQGISSCSVCVPGSPFRRHRAERGQCMPKFQLQKKPMCQEATSIPSRNVDMPSHVQWRCAQHQFPWPFYFQSLKSDSPDLTCISFCLLAQLLLAVIRWLFVNSVTLACTFVPVCQLPWNTTSWSSSCKPPSFIPLRSSLCACPSPAQILPHILYPGTAGNTFLWFF